jgi:hypothetical protein
MPTNASPGFDLAQIRLIFHPIWNVNVFLIYAAVVLMVLVKLLWSFSQPRVKQTPLGV